LARQAKEIIWQDLNQRRFFVLVYPNFQGKIVKPKGFQPIALTNMDFRFINADFMVVRIQTFMDLGIELIEEVITSQVIQMRRRLKALQV
jgi:hypothetical protein